MRTPTTPTTPNTSRSAVVLFGACAGVDGEPRSLMANLVSYEVSPLRGGIAAGEPNRVTGWNDLSRMKGNFQVRFLEGGGLATARLYSAKPSSAARPPVLCASLICLVEANLTI